jgi:hypothetical protein
VVTPVNRRRRGWGTVAIASLVVVILIPGGPVFGDLGPGDGTDGTANEGAGFISDEGAGAGTKGPADQGPALSRRAGRERNGGEGEETEFQGLFHGLKNGGGSAGTTVYLPSDEQGLRFMQKIVSIPQKTPSHR